MSEQTTVAPAPPDAADALHLCSKGVVLYTDTATGDLVIVPTRCHRWDCPTCAPHRQALARARARAGAPQRILTITLRPRPHESLDTRIDFIRLCWRRLSQRIRRNYGRFEWIAFLELQKNGTPHLHVLTRGCYIAQRWLSNAWNDLTGSFKVHIQKVNKVHRAVDECTKYYLKTAAQMTEHCHHRPLYTMSRNWLPEGFGDDPNREPPDPCSAFIRLTLPDVRHVVELLAGTLEPRANSPGSYTLHLPRPPTLHDLEQLELCEGGRREALALYFLYQLASDPRVRAAVLDELQAYHGLLPNAPRPICPSDARPAPDVPTPPTPLNDPRQDEPSPSDARQNRINTLLFPDYMVPRYA